MEKEKLNRINELAKIKKERPLTPEEETEKAALYKEYISEIRASFGATLDNTVIRRPDGTEEKLKKGNKS
jgi:uncharacterized protein YnzC (UPF0291/DUF896 family)